MTHHLWNRSKQLVSIEQLHGYNFYWSHKNAILTFVICFVLVCAIAIILCYQLAMTMMNDFMETLLLCTDKACFIYTSGTTGLPKACQIRHIRYFSMQAGITVCTDVSPDDIIYCTLPLYHTNGGVLCSGQMMYTGATLVIRKKFSASNFWQDCIKYKCTVSC